MATKSWRKSANLIDRIQENPHDFDFIRALSILEHAAHIENDEQLKSPGLKFHPDQECINFVNDNNLSFKDCDISEISPAHFNNNKCEQSVRKKWNVKTSFIGLTGSQGVFPFYFSELLIKENKNKNYALNDFLDIFHHRTVSLFYQASKKYRMEEFQYHSQHLEDSNFQTCLLGLCGNITKSNNNITPTLNNSTIGIAGFLSRNIRTESGIKGIIKEIFDVSIDLEQFKGEWFDLQDDVMCKLPKSNSTKGTNNQLGINTILGSKCYQAQNKFKVIIKEGKETDNKIIPGSMELENLKSLLTMATGEQSDFEIEIQTNSKNRKPLQLNKHLCDKPFLGWNTLLTNSSLSKHQDIENIIPVTISKNKNFRLDNIPETDFII